MNCSMVILNYNDKERSYKLAKRCLNFTCIEHIVIVDNCSPDGSFSWLKNHPLKNLEIIESDKNGGFSYGNNVGAKFLIENYNPEFILFANPDTMFEESSLIECLNMLSDIDDLGLISMRMINIEGYEENSCWKEKTYLQHTFFTLWLYRKVKYNSFLYDFTDEDSKLRLVDTVRGSFMCFKSSALKAIDFFDEKTFLYYEEDIITQRLKQKKYNVGILTKCFYIHDHVLNNTSNNPNMKRRLDKSMYYLLCNYYDINLFQRCFTKLILGCSYCEEFIFNFIRKFKN